LNDGEIMWTIALMIAALLIAYLLYALFHAEDI
jgi:K+-transporting ATPase KdpF subunit